VRDTLHFPQQEHWQSQWHPRAATFTPPEGRLHVNADASRGYVVVSLEDAAGRILATSHPITTDELAARVHWKTRPQPGDAPARLAFRLSAAKLFSYWFA
jgi:hypothetical protein